MTILKPLSSWLKSLRKLVEDNEPWNNNDASMKALEESIVKGRVCFLTYGDEVVGYCESWRLTNEQVLKVLNKNFSVRLENITDGPILWIANVTVDEKFRGSRSIIKKLRKMVFDRNSDAKLVGGSYNGTRTRHKNYKLVKLRRTPNGR